MRLRSSCILLLCLTLVACTSPRRPGPAAATATPVVEPAPTLSPPAGPITVTYWEEDSNEAGVLLDALAAAFMQANPGISVVRVHRGYADLRSQFRAAAFSSTGPTLVRAPGEFAGPFGELNIVKPLDELFSSDFLDQFFPGALDGATAQGKLWGLPDNFGGHLMLLYNKALISTIPTDTNAWVAQLKTLTDPANGQYGLVFPVSESYWLMPWLSGFGGWVLDAQGHVALDTAEMIEALWFLHDLRFQQRVLPESGGYEAAYDLFRSGKAAYIIDGAWNLAYYEGLGLEVGVATLPRVSQTGLLPAPMATGRYWFIAKDVSGAELDAAARFVEFMTSTEAQELWLAQMRRLPSLQGALRSATITTDPVLVGIMAQLRVARGVPPALEMACAWQGIGAFLPDVMGGQLSPDAAAPQMQAQADACVEEMGGYLTPTP